MTCGTLQLESKVRGNEGTTWCQEVGPRRQNSDPAKLGGTVVPPPKRPTLTRFQVEVRCIQSKKRVWKKFCVGDSTYSREQGVDLRLGGVVWAWGEGLDLRLGGSTCKQGARGGSEATCEVCLHRRQEVDLRLSLDGVNLRLWWCAGAFEAEREPPASDSINIF